jgi:hypothetical protein
MELSAFSVQHSANSAPGRTNSRQLMADRAHPITTPLDEHYLTCLNLSKDLTPFISIQQDTFLKREYRSLSFNSVC